MAFTVSLNRKQRLDVQFQARTTGGTANYKSLSTRTFSIPKGTKKRKVYVGLSKDNNTVGSTVEVEISNAQFTDGSNVIISDGEATGTIVRAPKKTSKVPGYSLHLVSGSCWRDDCLPTEESASLQFAVALTPSAHKLGEDVCFAYKTTAGGTATADVDYETTEGRGVFHADTPRTWVSLTGVRVPLIDDPEDGKTVEVKISEGHVCGDVARKVNTDIVDAKATGTIRNRQLSVSDAVATEGEDGSLDFVVTLSSAAEDAVTVDYATSDGTATAGSDYTADSGELTFSAGETTKTISVPIEDDEVEDDGETVTFTLSNASGAGIGDGEAVGTIQEPGASDPLTASFADVPTLHTGDAFTFDLTFSEDVGGLSHKTVKAAFDVTGGSVKKAKRRTQGSNQDWTITVEPTSASDTVTVTLPETTDCDATGAICTEDGRKLSDSQTATIDPVTTGYIIGDEVVQALLVMEGTTPDEAAAALFGERSLDEPRLAALDLLGNRNGSYDLGDLLSWIERCWRGEADCGGTSTDSGPAGGAALLPAAALLGGATSGRTRGSASGRREHRPVRRARRRSSMAGYGLMMLFVATMNWSCAGTDQVEAESDPGFLTVELTAPAANRDVGVLLELEGPSIETVRVSGYELYESRAQQGHQVIVAGSLRAGPLVQFRVPDRNQLSLYRVRVVQVTGDDYGLRDVGEHRTVLTN